MSFPDGPDLRSSGSGQNNNSIPIEDPDTSGHCPDTQSGFMQENTQFAHCENGIWIIFYVVILYIQESDIL